MRLSHNQAAVMAAGQHIVSMAAAAYHRKNLPGTVLMCGGPFGMAMCNASCDAAAAKPSGPAPALP